MKYTQDRYSRYDIYRLYQLCAWADFQSAVTPVVNR